MTVEDLAQACALKQIEQLRTELASWGAEIDRLRTELERITKYKTTNPNAVYLQNIASEALQGKK